MVARLLIGFLLMTVGYLLAVWSFTRVGHAATRIAIVFAALFRITLALLPGLFSTDVFSYVMYGRIAQVYSANPYVQPPDAFADDAFLPWVFPFWRDQPTVYGPLWTDLSWLLSGLTAHLTPFEQVMAYRFVLIALEAATLLLLWRLCRSTQAWVMFAWSPLVLFDLVASTHNDVAMLALLVLGLTLLTPGRGGRMFLALVSISLSALVKYATVVIVPVLAFGWASASTSTRTLAVRLAIGLGLPLAIAVALWWPWLQSSPDAFDVLVQAAGGRFVLNSAPDVVALTVADQVLVPGGVPSDVAQQTARFWTRTLTRALFTLYVAWELLGVWRAAPERTMQRALEAAARTLLVLPLLVFTWVWSWYFSWSLIVVVLLGSNTALARLVVAYTLVSLPVVYAHQYLNQQLSSAFVVALALAPLLLVLRRPREASGRPRSRSRFRLATGTRAGR
jgi:hypothetical protein